MTNKIEEYNQRQERQEALEHRDVLLAIGAIIKTNEGQKLFKYLFKSYEVAELPEQGLEGNILHENLGFLRAGRAIYKMTCEADPQQAALILSKIEREKYDRLYEQHRIDQGYSNDGSED